MAYTIWSNTQFSPAAETLLRQELAARGHRLVFSQAANANVLAGGAADPDLPGADIALGQPDPEQCLGLPELRWLEVVTAGYTRYDRPEFLEPWRERGAVFSNMSGVFAEPCAQHVLAMMLSLSRQLPASLRDQLDDQRWEYFQRRYDSSLLNGQTVLILSYGTIAKRLVELLAPFGMKIYALRRRAYSERGVHVIAEDRLSAVLPEVDHLVNILPDSEATRHFMNTRRFGLLKPTARFYNIGRGTTVDQNALLAALNEERLNAAYLDVMDPEPLPPEHPLWRARNCFITPHTGGGRRDQDEAIVKHFLANLTAFEAGQLDAIENRIV